MQRMMSAVNSHRLQLSAAPAASYEGMRMRQ